MQMQKLFMVPIILCACLAWCANAAEEKVQLTITGGHITDPQDRGRPVVLIGNALGVTPEVFRDAFSGVKPAGGGREPEPEQVRRNKAELVRKLSPHGVSNESIDRVSNYYRYRPESGRLWPVRAAQAHATLKDGTVVAIVITDGGAGYSSPPQISIPSHPAIKFKSTLAFGKDLQKNGAIAAIVVADKATR